MQFHIFTIPVTDDGSALEEMNRFLRSHKVLETEQQLVTSKKGSQWHFCVKYLANRKGKGTFAAIKQAVDCQRKYQWYLKLDVRKYFDSIDHDLLFSQLLRIFKEKQFLNLLWNIIDSYHASDDKGLPIGNLTSQFFANHYLSSADQYLTAQLHIPAFIRYMDDIIIWSNDRDELIDKGNQFECFMKEHLYLG